MRIVYDEDEQQSSSSCVTGTTLQKGTYDWQWHGSARHAQDDLFCIGRLVSLL